MTDTRPANASTAECWDRYERCISGYDPERIGLTIPYPPTDVESGNEPYAVGPNLQKEFEQLQCSWELIGCLKELSGPEGNQTPTAAASSGELVDTPSASAEAEAESTALVSTLASPTGPSMQEFVKAALILEASAEKLLQQLSARPGGQG